MPLALNIEAREFSPVDFGSPPFYYSPQPIQIGIFILEVTFEDKICF
jgi:hypothetical protein